jgi:hypothetical protein
MDLINWDCVRLALDGGLGSIILCSGLRLNKGVVVIPLRLLGQADFAPPTVPIHVEPG